MHTEPGSRDTPGTRFCRPVYTAFPVLHSPRLPVPMPAQVACYEPLPPDMDILAESRYLFPEISFLDLISSPNSAAMTRTEVLKSPLDPAPPGSQDAWAPIAEITLPRCTSYRSHSGCVDYGDAQQENESAEFSLGFKPSDSYLCL